MGDGAAKTFRDLLVWRKAHQLVLRTYQFTAGFPKTEAFGLTSQLRRAAVSIPANIVEGFRRRSALEKTRFYNIAQASLDEAHYYLILANDLNYGDSTALLSQLQEVSRLLDAYTNSVRTNIKSNPPSHQ
jgi:four helix bundle protein